MLGRFKRSMGKFLFLIFLAIASLFFPMLLGRRTRDVVYYVFANCAFGFLFRAITLTKNSQFWVRQGDVERLIAQGYLQKLS